jgi:hypothetical protein
MADGSRKRRLDLDDGSAGASTPSGSSSPSKQPRPVGSSGAAASGYGADAPTTNPLNGRPYSSKYHELRKTRMSLPVFQFLDQLEGHLRTNQVVIVEGETGSGKTTQVRKTVASMRAQRCSGGAHRRPQARAWPQSPPAGGGGGACAAAP